VFLLLSYLTFSSVAAFYAQAREAITYLDAVHRHVRGGIDKEANAFIRYGSSK